MTFSDWVHDSRRRYREESFGHATRESAVKFIHGAVRRFDRYFGTPVWDRGDWDVLIILDACRHDIWEEVAPEYDELPDEAPYIRSNASCSIGWIKRTFNRCPEEASTAGYVTANPFANHDTPTTESADITGSQVAHFDPLYETEWTEVTPSGDMIPDDVQRAKVGSGVATVPPKTVTDYAIDRWRRRAGGMNRLVVHYMQPHEPYITRPGWGSGDSDLLGNLIDPEEQAGASVWPKVQDGEVDLDEFWEVYCDNLRWVLDDITERLLPNIEGDVVISADHGNGLGEWGVWHHPPGAIGPGVRRVPWVEIECSDSETIKPELDGEMTENTSMEEKLEALGYL